MLISTQVPFANLMSVWRTRIDAGLVEFHLRRDASNTQVVDRTA